MTIDDLKTITVTAPAVLVRQYGNYLAVVQSITLPPDADETLWTEFPSEAEARAFYGIYEPMTNAEMLEGLGIQPTGGLV